MIGIIIAVALVAVASFVAGVMYGHDAANLVATLKSDIAKVKATVQSEAADLHDRFDKLTGVTKP